MNPAELFKLLAGLTKHTQDFTIQTEFVDPTWYASDVRAYVRPFILRRYGWSIGRQPDLNL